MNELIKITVDQSGQYEPNSRNNFVKIFKGEDKLTDFLHDWGIEDKPVFLDRDVLKMNQILTLKIQILRYMDLYTHIFHDYVLTEIDGNQYVCLEEITSGKFPMELLWVYTFLPYLQGLPFVGKKNGKTYVSGCALEAINNFKKLNFENSKPPKKFKTYVMYDRSLNLYKIGKAIKPKAREKTLQGEKPDIQLILILDFNIERELHIEFKFKRVRGEWFRLEADDILELIEVHGFKPPTAST